LNVLYDLYAAEVSSINLLSEITPVDLRLPCLVMDSRASTSCTDHHTWIPPQDQQMYPETNCSAL